MFSKLTTLGKICVITIIMAIVGTGLYYAGKNLTPSKVGSGK